MEIWHLRFSSDGRHPLFPSEWARRAAVMVLVGHAAPWLVAFGIVDDHLHVVVVCCRERAGKLSRAIVLGMRPIAGLGFGVRCIGWGTHRLPSIGVIRI